MPISRRHALLAGAALPLAAPALLRARPLLAQEAPAMPLMPQSRDFRLGAATVTALLAGSAAQEDPQSTFGMNVDPETFARASAAAFIPADRSVGFFTPTLLRRGSDVILFDTGLMAGGITAALASAGVEPGAVTHVVLTHMHPDHIGGLTDDAGAPTFPDAAYLAGRLEFDFWAGQGNEGFEAKVRPFAPRMTFLEPGSSPLAGVTPVAAYGHTPGHMAFLLEDAGEALLVTADTANHYVWSLGHPDWEVRFDADKAEAAATRRQVFGMAARERLPVLGYHLPWPALGYVEPAGDGFAWVAHSYQLL